MTKMIIVSVLVTVVIVTECLFAYLMIPSTADVEAWAKGQHGKAGEHGKEGEHGEHGEHGGHGEAAHSGHGEAEVELGKFNVIVHEPSSQVTLRVNFHLIGTVPEEEHTEFEHLLEKHEHRLRAITRFSRSGIARSKTSPILDWPCSSGGFWRKVTTFSASPCSSRWSSATSRSSSNRPRDGL
jgi:hypothetical protein